jgi:hypothetical protein
MYLYNVQVHIKYNVHIPVNKTDEASLGVNLPKSKKQILVHNSYLPLYKGHNLKV